MSSNASWRSKLERLLLTACSHWIVYVVWALAGWPRSLRLPGKVYGRLTPEKVRDILSEYYLLEQV